MKFNLTQDNELAVLRMHETRLDTSTAPELKAELLVLFKSEVQFLILDLSEVIFCDSSGLSALLLAERQLREVDGGLLVVDPIGKIKSLLKIANLENIILAFDSLDDARNALEQ